MGGTAVYARRSSIRLDGRNWEDILSAMEPMDVDGLHCVATDYLDPQKGQISMEPEVIWHLLGGELGLRRMRNNADLLLSLAAHAAQWNTEEGAIVAERMRRDALRLRSALRQIRLGMFSQIFTGRHWVSVPFQLQEAASAYYLMRQRLLALYETSHVGLLPQLAQAI
ncbi:hypothetical protein D1Y84_04075 [Acidipila sp. EB88]|nr:hypothetical protein D1Y84_04075 [Acidipila sp. EB88]